MSLQKYRIKGLMRLFIAIQFDEHILRELTRYQADLKAHSVTGNFSREENLHITLAFIGEYSDPDEVLDAMEEVPFKPFDIDLDGVGQFGDIFWAGISHNPGLEAYVKRLRRQLAAKGIPFDKKRFSPHITLVRKAAGNIAVAVAASEPPKGHMWAEKISLMKSERGRNGMIYTELGSYCFIL